MLCGDANPQQIAGGIKPFLHDSLLIISSDLSHYHPYAVAQKKDSLTINAIESLDYDKCMQQGDACGIIPILTAINLAKDLGWKCKLLDYKNSGDTAGDKSRVVGYASFVMY